MTQEERLNKDKMIYATSLVLVEHFSNCINIEHAFNSRIFEHILHPEKNFVAIGQSQEVINGAKVHPEHVVPCATLINECKRLITEGIEKEEIAKLLAKHWKIVFISKEEANLLDTKSGLNLKHKMPEGWTFENGDTFERLKLANIKVLPLTKI